MCQHTNYHDTTNHGMYLPRLELLRSHDINAVNYHVPKYYKTFGQNGSMPGSSQTVKTFSVVV